MEKLSEHKGKIALASSVALLGGLAYYWWTSKEKEEKKHKYPFYADDQAFLIKKYYGNLAGDNTAIIVGATPELLHIYVNLVRQGYMLFLIGHVDDEHAVLKSLKDAINEIEGMEYPDEAI